MTPMDVTAYAFRRYVQAAAANKELLREFDRLHHSHLADGGPLIIRGIDLATGKLADDIITFIRFCQENFERLPAADRKKLEAP